ncbi:hypothetical protein TWF703_004000 [Orbilia oligospora]|uniref:Uncharacterized protein n=2 Tax=Orbilia oligospora TaxID=2813651 RepID=A0A7C8NYB1_ORBOL|nr:hypothetical protein TWF703_004000 [Orbilia oligospora]
MYSLKYFLLATAFVAQASATTNPTACNADNCLRALRGFSSKSYAQVSSDCSNYIYSTVALEVVTEYDTTTIPVRVTLPTNILYTTTEETSFGVETKIEYDITTEISFRNIMVTVTGEAPIPAPTEKKRALKERHYTGTSPLPSYATPCSSGVRYASACSCLGVPPSIVTVAASTTTSVVTLYNTETLYTTNSVAVDTEYITVPAGTETKTIESTATIVSVSATNTVFALVEVEGPHSDGRLWMPQVMPWWQFYFADTSHPLVRDSDGRIYFGQLGARWYAYCEHGSTTAFFDPGEGNDAAVVHFYRRHIQSNAGVVLLGTELYCDFGINEDISCHCTTPEGEWKDFMYGPYGLIQLSKQGYQYQSGEGKLVFRAYRPRVGDYCGPESELNAVCPQYWDPNSSYSYKKKRNSKAWKRRLSD